MLLVQTGVNILARLVILETGEELHLSLPPSVRLWLGQQVADQAGVSLWLLSEGCSSLSAAVLDLLATFLHGGSCSGDVGALLFHLIPRSLRYSSLDVVGFGWIICIVHASCITDLHNKQLHSFVRSLCYPVMPLKIFKIHVVLFLFCILHNKINVSSVRVP